MELQEIRVTGDIPPPSSSSTQETDPEGDEALELAWNNVSVRHGKKKLLFGVSGRVKGKFLAIMGGSGSGKTTLLNFLALRLHPQTKQEGGTATMDGGLYSSNTLKRVAGYVVQDDLLFANLTVYETLLYAARLRLPATFTDEERQDRVDETIKKLGLTHCRDTIIGDELRRGVSGGERKRVCVGIELLLRPNVLLLDEPTSGLDSASALSLCETLKNLAASGSCTVITTIHQPQSKIFNLFDELVILNKGHVIYKGPRAEILDFYEAAGIPCPQYTNPADHILDAITLVPGSQAEEITQNIRQLEQQYKKKYGEEAAEEEEDDKDSDHKALIDWKPTRNYPRTPWFDQFKTLLKRSIKDSVRNRKLWVSQLIQTAIMAVLIGTVFLQIGTSQTSTARRQPVLFFCVVNQGVFGALIVINTFPSERKIILRERAAGTYFSSAYFMAKIASDTVLQLLMPILFSVIVYWLVGLQHTAQKFFIFMAFMILCSLSATSIALFISAVCRTTTMAVSVLPMALEVARLFGGFFLSPALLPNYFSWLDALSYAKYTYVGISLNELQGLVLTCTDAQRNAAGNCPVPNGEFTIKALGLDKYSITMCAFVLVAFITFFRTGAYFAIRFIKH
eukprot:TRINITY_DN1997_c0_g2_i1.p1 TRINITY_DN1997_c0_g2~~TRINITY_DN1997_c0_g2_i1.p1  ORF type:complete len:623 (+),score=155.49 TRINITY_DN1997_c0_g2_i1:63-1931(+)